MKSNVAIKFIPANTYRQVIMNKKDISQAVIADSLKRKKSDLKSDFSSGR